MRKRKLVIALFGASALARALSHAQSADAFAKALHVYGTYRVAPNKISHREQLGGEA